MKISLVARTLTLFAVIITIWCATVNGQSLIAYFYLKVALTIGAAWCYLFLRPHGPIKSLWHAICNLWHTFLNWARRPAHHVAETSRKFGTVIKARLEKLVSWCFHVDLGDVSAKRDYIATHINADDRQFRLVIWHTLTFAVCSGIVFTIAGALCVYHHTIGPLFLLLGISVVYFSAFAVFCKHTSVSRDAIGYYVDRYYEIGTETGGAIAFIQCLALISMIITVVITTETGGYEVEPGLLFSPCLDIQLSQLNLPLLSHIGVSLSPITIALIVSALAAIACFANLYIAVHDFVSPPDVATVKG